MIHHPLVKEMSILGSSFLCLYGTHTHTRSEQGAAAGASSHRLIITVETCQMINSFQRFNLSLPPYRV